MAVIDKVFWNRFDEYQHGHEADQLSERVVEVLHRLAPEASDEDMEVAAYSVIEVTQMFALRWTNLTMDRRLGLLDRWRRELERLGFTE